MTNVTATQRQLPRKPKGLLADNGVGGGPAQPPEPGVVRWDPQPLNTTLAPSTSRRDHAPTGHADSLTGQSTGAPDGRAIGNTQGCPDAQTCPPVLTWPKPATQVCHRQPSAVSPPERQVHAGRPAREHLGGRTAHTRADTGCCSPRTNVRPDRTPVRLFVHYRGSETVGSRQSVTGGQHD
jgi:hypothetical protein